jgi:hypothetical protein
VGGAHAPRLAGSPMRPFFAGICVWCAAGCASEQTVAVLGEAGLVAWSTTVYYSGDAPSSWAEAAFAAGDSYTLTAVLTDDGTSSILAPDTITHRLRFADGESAGTVEHREEWSSAGIPIVDAEPTTAGTAYLEALYQGEVVDVVAMTVIAGRVQVDDGVVYGVDDGRW